MCWRDDVVTERYCSVCGQSYYGDLGHRGCPARSRPKLEDSLKTESLDDRDIIDKLDKEDPPF